MRHVFSTLMILLSILMLSCNEEEGNLVEGRITAYPDDSPLQGIDTKLEVNKIEQGSYSNSWTLLGEGETDSNGEFSFEFDAVRAHEYKLTVSHDLYRNQVIEFEPTDFAANYNKNICMVKDASLEIHIRNILQPTNTTDEIRIRVSDIPTECSDCSADEFLSLTGIIDTTLTYQVVGDDNVHIEYTIIKDESEFFQSWQYMTANQVNTKTINF